MWRGLALQPAGWVHSAENTVRMKPENKRTGKRTGFKKSPSILRRMLTKNFRQHPLYFQKTEEKKTEEKKTEQKKMEQKKMEQKKMEQKKTEQKKKVKGIEEILKTMICEDVIRPIEEVEGKFKNLKKNIKYLLVAVETPAVLLYTEQVYIRVVIPKCVPPPPPPPNTKQDYNKNIFLLRVDGKVTWVIE